MRIARGHACQQQPAADDKRESGRCNDAHVGQSVDLILGTEPIPRALSVTAGNSRPDAL
jgi:hypothetical protein